MRKRHLSTELVHVRASSKAIGCDLSKMNDEMQVNNNTQKHTKNTKSKSYDE